MIVGYCAECGNPSTPGDHDGGYCPGCEAEPLILVDGEEPESSGAFTDVKSFLGSPLIRVGAKVRVTELWDPEAICKASQGRVTVGWEGTVTVADRYKSDGSECNIDCFLVTDGSVGLHLCRGEIELVSVPESAEA